MKSIVFIFFMIQISFNLLAETTPMDQVLVEDGVTLIAVDLKKAELKDKNPENAKLIDGTYHYNVYVPAGYNTQKERKYACLFIASPGGNAALGNVKSWVKSKEWIVVMLVESKNGDWGPIFSNFTSAHDDAVKRLRIQPGFKFGTGFSGGARVSSNMPRIRDGFAGIILQGAGFGGGYDSCLNNKNLTVYAIIGNKDGNFYELGVLESKLPAFTTRKLITTNAGHSWAEESEMEKGLDWSIDQAFKKTRMTSDNKLFLVGFRENQWKNANQLPVGLEKLNQLEDLSGFLKSSRLTALGAEEDIVTKVNNVIAELKKDTIIIKESGAEKAFVVVQESETNLRGRFKDKKQLTGQINPLYQNYLNISKKFPDTEYGKKALEAADALKEEFFGDKK
jgi:hypothetical protein